MKAFTDINQSQKLAEILPTESADAWWAERHEGKVTYDGQYIVNEEPIYYISFIKPSEINYSQDTVKDIPCWSLAALLDILRDKAYSIDEDAIVTLSSYKTVEWDLSISNSGLNMVTKSDPIDACVEMIVKLKEQDLL